MGPDGQERGSGTAADMEAPYLPVLLQGDMEKAAGLPISPLFDRTTTGISKSQVRAALPTLVCELMS